VTLRARFKQLEPSGGKETRIPAAARDVPEREEGDLAVVEARACGLESRRKDCFS
jgi:hypothetical protein